MVARTHAQHVPLEHKSRDWKPVGFYSHVDYNVSFLPQSDDSFGGMNLSTSSFRFLGVAKIYTRTSVNYVLSLWDMVMVWMNQI